MFSSHTFESPTAWDTQLLPVNSELGRFSVAPDQARLPKSSAAMPVTACPRVCGSTRATPAAKVGDPPSHLAAIPDRAGHAAEAETHRPRAGEDSVAGEHTAIQPGQHGPGTVTVGPHRPRRGSAARRHVADADESATVQLCTPNRVAQDTLTTSEQPLPVIFYRPQHRCTAAWPSQRNHQLGPRSARRSLSVATAILTHPARGRRCHRRPAGRRRARPASPPRVPLGPVRGPRSGPLAGGRRGDILALMCGGLPGHLLTDAKSRWFAAQCGELPSWPSLSGIFEHVHQPDHIFLSSASRSSPHGEHHLPPSRGRAGSVARAARKVSAA